MYATLDRARAAGAAGDDAEVTATVLAAQERINRYTAQVWEPTVTTVAAKLGQHGLAVLPYRVRIGQPYTVRLQGSTVDLAATAYSVRSSAVPGDVDALQLGGAGTSSALVLGAEPWRGGFAGLFDRIGAAPGRLLYVTGSFGYEAAPPVIAQATALLAALLQGAGQESDDANSTGLDVDAEGRSLMVSGTAPVMPEMMGTGRRSTGYPAVDVLLAGMTSRPVRIN